MAGTLYLIPTNLSAPFAPAGILPADVIATTLGLDYFIAENAKSARAFLKGIGIARPLQEVTIAELGPKADFRAMMNPLLDGRDAGLVSEAGAPGVADPGAEIVAFAHRLGIPVMPLVGPSSLLLGLMASGLNGQKFAFHGYLPQEKTARLKAIHELERESHARKMTQLFIETPYRNGPMLADLLATLAPSTRLCVAADLTGNEQYIRTASVAEWRKSPVELGKVPALFLLLA